MNFKSQICTTKEQSKRLLALGLKKETADMVHSRIVVLDVLVDLISEYSWTTTQEVTDYWYPAWSLHRLIEIVSHTQYPYYVISKELPIYDALCERIQWLIKEGYFNKEYLV